MTLTKTKTLLSIVILSDPFDKLLMPKVERVYNLRIDIVTKRKKLYQLKMLFNKLTNMSSFRFVMVSIHKLYTRCSYCIFYGLMNEGNFERKFWQELLGCLFHCNIGTLREQSCLSTLFHITARQLCRNVKAYNRNIGRNHCSVQ